MNLFKQKKRKAQRQASKYHFAHAVLFLTVLATGAASVLAAVYTVSEWNYASYAMPVVAAIAGGLALLPPALAHAWGESDNQNTKAGLMLFAIVVMVLDGAAQANVIRVGYELAGVDAQPGTSTYLLIGGYQATTFFLRGLLFTATTDRELDLSLQREREAEAKAKLERVKAEEKTKQRKREQRKARTAARKGQHLKSV